MKKIIIIMALIIMAIIAGIFLITYHKAEADVTETATKVGVIMNGSKTDRSWNQAHYEGLEKTAAELNLDITYKECVTEDKVTEIINGFAKDNCKIIIAGSFEFGKYMVEGAEKYPEIFFFHATGTESGKNMSSYFGRMYQMRYLTGIAAGLQTETNEIGYVAAFPISEVNRGINAFTLGVKSVNPEAKVYVKWTNSWGDNSLTAEVTEKLISSHNIDILAMHSDSLEPVRIADKHGIMSIGYNVDNSSLYPDTFLTAAVWDWEIFYMPNILKCLQGKFDGRNYWEGSKTGIIKTAPLSDKAKEGIADAMEKERKHLDSGTYDVFYGPIYDNKGILRIAEGESMTDYAMLNEFNWYVEGGIIDE